MAKERLSWDEYYLDIAFQVSKKSSCKRRRFGTIILKNDSIISTGYNGPARGAPNCLEIGCLKEEHNEEAGKSYIHCRTGPLHSEINAIINAAREHGGTLGAKMYIAGEYPDGRGLCDAYPCKICQKEIINAGIEEVIIRTKDREIKKFKIEDWVKEAYKTEDKDIKGFY